MNLTWEASSGIRKVPINGDFELSMSEWKNKLAAVLTAMTKYSAWILLLVILASLAH